MDIEMLRKEIDKALSIKDLDKADELLTILADMQDNQLLRMRENSLSNRRNIK